MRRDLVCLRRRRDDRQIVWAEADVATHETLVGDFGPFRAIACRFKVGWTPLRRPRAQHLGGRSMCGQAGMQATPTGSNGVGWAL